MHESPCTNAHSPVSASIYDRQRDTALFKRFLARNFTHAPAQQTKTIGPGAYNPLTIEEIYRQKSCSKYGPYYQQSERFPSKSKPARRSCQTQDMVYSLSNITDERQRKHDFERRFNAIRLDRQSEDRCRQRRALAPRAPPMTLYEKPSFVDELLRKRAGIYGPYVKLADDRQSEFPAWYKGPGRFIEKSAFQTLYSAANRHKGKFLPLPSHRRGSQAIEQPPLPGPTTYFQERHSPARASTISEGKRRFLGFLSSTERFQQLKSSRSNLGPAFYKLDTCHRSCSQRKQMNTSV